jgi:hypothetical protein
MQCHMYGLHCVCMLSQPALPALPTSITAALPCSAPPASPLAGWLALQLVLDVEPLESGRSADATGRLVVTRREGRPAQPVQAPPAMLASAAAAAAAEGRAPGSWVLSYKLAESGATYVQQLQV